MALLRFYLGYEAQAIIAMQVDPELMPAPVLESETLSLGFTSLLACDENRPRHTPIQVRLGTWNTPARSWLGMA